ncbi:SDR family NAD(P)-dependent oxidoreductase [Agromyces laixinhei]|uniref:SDR family NAD(P)-dependent oxidoreductase n=1 Tax=Agromyces laixinhei TaxID=2585717 RepID=UPI001115B084|nr:glucose 1-dehydrogenase [Agromyces laixinhei]
MPETNSLGLAEKNGLVTAAGDGIGRASALAFAAAGARVLISDIAPEGLEETARLIREAGGIVETMVGDASAESMAEASVARVVELWGSLDFAHNNAGIGAPNAPFTEQDRAAWERIFSVNVFGTMAFMKHELRQMEKQASGAIVNTASMAGKDGSPGLSPYVASKWAVNGMTQTAALEYAARGIRVNSICPGATLTTALRTWRASSPEAYDAVAASIPMRRMGEPEEQAAAAVWLCSAQASYITGTLLNVEGGDGILGKQ